MNPQVSSRAKAVLDGPGLPEYIDAHFEHSEDEWDADTNPDGYISLCIAENRLVWDVLQPRISESRSTQPSSFEYDSMIGSIDFRTTLSHFMGRELFGIDVDPEQLAVVNGVGSALDLLFYVLCDPGEGVLVPTPSYAGFWLDLETRDEVSIIPVHCSSENNFALTTEALDAAIANADVPVKALLFTNPNNPLATIASKDEIGALIDWAHDTGVHIVFDEIYALSTLDDTPFVSAASMPQADESVHVVWGFSKDFAMSGLRVGVIHTENKVVHQAVDGLSYWAATSGDTQAMLTQLLSDEAWVSGYLAENQSRLRETYIAITEVLDRYGVIHLPAQAGLFFLVDVRPMMRDITWEEEDRVWRELLEASRVNLTPGSAGHNGEPGFMRFVFSGVTRRAALEGAERIGNYALNAASHHDVDATTSIES
jgi:aspartate/methionine/tyrosine aminotransferase